MLNIWTVIPLATCMAYVVVFIFAVQQIKKQVNRAFVYYLGLAAFWSFTSFMVRFTTAPGLALFWNRILVVALIGTLVAYYHFVRLYSGHRPGIGTNLGYLILPVMLVLSLATPWFIESSHVVDGTIIHTLGPGVYAIGVISLIYTVSVLYFLRGKYRHSRDPIDRNRTSYLLAGWTILAPMAYTNLLPVLKGFPLDHIGSFINVAIIAYAITRYDLLDVRLVARRGLGWIMMIVFYGGIYTGLVYAGLNFLSEVSSVIVVVSASVFVLLLFAMTRPLRKMLEEVVDRLFYRNTYDYRQALAQFGLKMGGNLNLDELAKELLPMLANAINISKSYLLLRDRESGDLKSLYYYPSTEEQMDEERIVFDPDSPIVTWLDKHDEHLSLEKIDQLPEFKALWLDEREQLDRLGIRILFPVKSRERLVAVLALGAKRNGRLYSAEDLSVLAGIAKQAGVILENAQLYTFAMMKANTDELTGLYNHRHFHERLEQEIARGSRFGSTFSMIMIDIDLFKVYNDIYGHLAGDQVLRKVGQYIESSIRSIDLAFRYGGEEFAIILPEARIQDAFKVAERIRKTIESKTSSRAMPVTVSLGAANWPNDGVMREEIIGAADTALYHAKNSGRNRTSLSHEVIVPGEEKTLEQEGQSRSISIIYALAATVDAKDSYTYGHSRKVSEYAVSIAEALELPELQISTIRAAGLLHDIGKIGVPDSILNKKEPLTDLEWGPIKTHPEIGVEILRHVSELSDCLPLILHHHERYDGKGYPAGLKGTSIPIGARILTIADAFDAMTTPRPYRGRMSFEDALEELEKHAGTQFDQALVSVFAGILKTEKTQVPGQE